MNSSYIHSSSSSNVCLDSVALESIYRVVDANANRLREGLRVLEDIARFILQEPSLAKTLKELRHKGVLKGFCDAVLLLRARDSRNDVLRINLECEYEREGLEDLVTSNFKRCEESARVLEEVFKVLQPRLQALEESKKFKHIRYTLYTLEKDFFKSAWLDQP